MSRTRILIAEHEPGVAAGLERRLRAFGHEVVATVHDADAAIEGALALRPDLVFMDIELPGERDGIDAAAAILRHLPLPVVFVSEWTDAATVDRAKALAPAGFLIKPLEDPGLRVAIELALFRRDMQLEREHAHTRLRSSENILAAVFESALDGTLVLDENGRVLQANRCALLLLRATAEEVRGQALRRFVPPEHVTLPEYMSSIDAETVLRSGHLPLSEVSVTRLDGSTFPAEVALAPVGTSTSAMIIATVRDITEYRAREDELRLRLRVMEESPTAVLVTDARRHDNPVVYLNPAFTRLTGYEKAEMLGHNCRLLQGGERDEQHIARLREALARNESCQVVLRNQRRDGSMFWNELSISPVLDEHGKASHFIGTLVDVTHRQEEEAQLRDTAALLEERVRQRTVELEAATRSAENANAAKSEFLATMSHEVRTPMTGVLGMVDLLQTMELPPVARHRLSVIHSAGRTLMHILDDILDLSRIEAGRMELAHQPLDLDQTLEHCVESFRGTCMQQQVSMDYERDERLPARVRGDAMAIRQVLSNLLSNAIKFAGTPARPGEVQVSVAPAPDDDHGSPAVLITVQDNGAGMSEAALQRIFAPFVQAGERRHRGAGGSGGFGLGLAIALRLANLMGGTIEARSTPGAGSTFTATLQVGLVEETAAPLLAGVSCNLLGVAPALERRLRRHLECAGATVTTCDEAQGALSITVDKPRCVLLVDATSSALSGAADALQRQPRVVLLVEDDHSSPVLQQWTVFNTRPLLPATLVRMLAELTAPSGARSAQRRGSIAGSRLLVVEDDAVTREVLAQQLDLLEVRHTIVADAESALHELSIHDHDLVLTDIEMPGMDGLALTAAIREREVGSGHRLPVIAITANALPEQLDRCLAGGMDDCLVKPFSMDLLAQMLHRWTATGEQAAAPETEPQDTPVPAAGSDASQPLDVSVLSRMLGDDPADHRRLLRRFHDSLDDFRVQLAAAHEAGDAVTQARHAHRLKSSARALGAATLATLCEKVEHAARTPDLEDLARLAPRVDSEIDRLEIFLETLLDAD